MKKRKIKKWKMAAFAIVLLLAVWLAASFFSDGEEDMAPAVETAEVTQGDITSVLDTSGIISSEQIRVYASPVNAQVGEIPVVPGQSVHKGEYLLTYDTTSLQKSYDIAQLQAKAEAATSNDTLAKSSESASDLASSAGDINTLQGQIDALNAEIAGLQAQATDNEMKSNKNTELTGEISALQAEAESLSARIAELEAKAEAGVLSEKEKETLSQLKKEKKSKENKISKKQKSAKSAADLANAMTGIQALITQKNSQLADLQTKLGEAQSKNAAAEAGILSEAAKANISYSQQASKLTLEQTENDLSRAKAGITADFDGIVTEVAASAGTMAAEGTPLITLASANDMCVEIPVSKYNLANLKPGQSAVITFQEREYSGTVNYISKVAQKGESGAAMVTIKVHINNPDEDLILGLDASAKIDLGTAKNVLAVPVSAVNSDTQGDFVYVAEGGIAVKKYVVTGMASTEEIEIKSGLMQGEKVIVTIDADLTEGMPVTENTENADKDANAGLATEASE